jgi:hypothetical protein
MPSCLRVFVVKNLSPLPDPYWAMPGAPGRAGFWRQSGSSFLSQERSFKRKMPGNARKCPVFSRGIKMGKRRKRRRFDAEAILSSSGSKTRANPAYLWNFA